ncbi:hypothetical protein [Microbacterium testaceum]|uniref:hypothetical protein n=1 Tax=Microbacterium testaceum TaxID=2033 RepID=UPI00128E98DB|nr:hypothetical protein [Microbacterium testaceum]
MGELWLLIDEAGRHGEVPGDVLRVVFAEGLQFVARRARKVPRRDLFGDLRTALTAVLRRPGRTRVFAVEATGRSGSGAPVARGPPARSIALATVRTVPVTPRSVGPLAVTTIGAILVPGRAGIVVAAGWTLTLPTERPIAVTLRATVHRVVASVGPVPVSGRAGVVVTAERTVAAPRRATGALTITAGGTIAIARGPRISVPAERTVAIAPERTITATSRPACALTVAAERTVIARRTRVVVAPIRTVATP